MASQASRCPALSTLVFARLYGRRQSLYCAALLYWASNLYGKGAPFQRQYASATCQRVGKWFVRGSHAALAAYPEQSAGLAAATMPASSVQILLAIRKGSQTDGHKGGAPASPVAPFELPQRRKSEQPHATVAAGALHAAWMALACTAGAVGQLCALASWSAAKASSGSNRRLGPRTRRWAWAILPPLRRPVRRSALLSGAQRSYYAADSCAQAIPPARRANSWWRGLGPGVRARSRCWGVGRG
jgi:hypothetical protein